MIRGYPAISAIIRLLVGGNNAVANRELQNSPLFTGITGDRGIPDGNNRTHYFYKSQV